MDKDLPANFSSAPNTSSHKYFHNLCLQFKKLLTTTKDLNILEDHMQLIINASKDMSWKDKNPKGVWKKKEGEKIIDKIFDEFKRYSVSLKKNSQENNLQNVLEALETLNQLIKSEKVE